MVAEGSVSSFNGDPLCRVDLTTDIPWGGEHCGSDYNAGGTARTVGIVGLAGGAVSAVLGVILLATAPSRREGREHAAVLGCGPGPGSVGLACGGRF